jgi:hypothetical protein
MLNNKESPVTKYRAWIVTNDTSKNVKLRSTIDFTKTFFSKICTHEFYSVDSIVVSKHRSALMNG